MHLIYKINFKNGKVYIGLTTDLQKRMTDHLKEARSGNNSKVYRAMRKYSTTRLDFEIIETNIETLELSNKREIYWIAKYDSFKNGYNSNPGGDAINVAKGEDSIKAIFTNDEVLEIRKLRADKNLTRSEVYKFYKDKISESGFGKIWNYEVYTEIGTELNSEDILHYHKTKKPSGYKNKNNKFNLKEIQQIRNLYYIDAKSSSDIATMFNVNKSCIERIVAGKTYSDLPIPEPSIKFKRKFHRYTLEELQLLIKDFLSSGLSISVYLNNIKKDESNIFGGYGDSSFRKLINELLKKEGFKYIPNNRHNFEIVPI